MKTNVRQWYLATCPTDELGQEINGSITFWDMFDALDNYQDIYELIGIGDSMIRERCFEKLADIMRVDYDYIYDQWLRSSSLQKTFTREA